MSKSNLLAASGFLLDIGEEHYFVTAGHAFHEIEMEEEANQRRLVRAALLNPWASESGATPPHYIDYYALPKHFEDDDASGADLGFIRLPDDLYAALMNSGTVPIQPCQLRRPADAVVDQYWICGVPRCLSERDVSEWLTCNTAAIELVAFCFRVLHLDGLAGGFTRTTRERFYASLPAEVSFAHVDGCSGAAVFSLTRNAQGTFDLWVEAVQAQYRPTVRTIAATPFPLSLDIVERAREHFASQ